jgi:hypothetical protein
MPTLYHKMNKTIGRFGDCLYVHNVVPGIIAMTSRAEPDVTLYGIKLDSMQALYGKVWIGNTIDPFWGWLDKYFGVGYRFKLRSDITPPEKDIAIRFKQVEQAYRARVARPQALYY